MTSALSLYNSLTRKKEPLRTGQPGRVAMYVCGPTVYNFAHIGNARPAVVFDVLARLLREQYAEVVYARNFTDVDDKINASAAAETAVTAHDTAIDSLSLARPRTRAASAPASWAC